MCEWTACRYIRFCNLKKTSYARVVIHTYNIYVINQSLILFSVINLNAFLPTTYYYDDLPPLPPPPHPKDIAQLACLHKWPDKNFRENEMKIYFRGEGISSALESFHTGRLLK